MGSSCQISETLVNRIQLLEKEKESMNAVQWEAFKAERVKTYLDENSVKVDKYHLRKEVRAEVAREKKRLAREKRAFSISRRGHKGPNIQSVTK